MIFSIRSFDWSSLQFFTEVDSFLGFFRLNLVMNSLPLVVIAKASLPHQTYSLMRQIHQIIYHTDSGVPSSGRYAGEI